MEAGFEILIHVDQFRNIDLFRQGLYFLKIYCYTVADSGAVASAANAALQAQADEQTQATPHKEEPYSAIWRMRNSEALPYNFVSHPYQSFAKSGLLSEEEFAEYSSHIDSAEGCFVTRAFRVQFVEQVVVIKEACQFRLNMHLPNVKSTNIYLDVDLMFCEYHSTEYAKDRPFPPIEEFHSVARKTFRLQKLNEGVHSFYPLSFDDSQFCLVNLVVHTTLLNFQYKAILDANTEKPLNFCDYLYPNFNALDHAEITRVADEHHKYYLMTLIQAYVRLASFLNRFYDGEQSVDPPKLDRLVEENVESSFKLPKLLALSSRIEELLPETVATQIVDDANFISAQIFYLWQRFVSLSSLNVPEIDAALFENWEEDVRDHWGSSIFRETLTFDDRTLVMDDHNSKLHSHVSRVIRTSRHLQELHPLIVEDVTVSTMSDQLVVIFEQTFNTVDEHNITGQKRLPKLLKRTSPSGATRLDRRSDNSGKHLFVFLHGYQGTSWDMRMFRNYMAVLFPNSVFLLSTCNESATDGDIREMGVRLSEEIHRFVGSNFNSPDDVGRMSFIAHSLGGVILRSALTTEVMTPYLSKLYTFFSLGSPHCGYLYSTNPLVNTGIWFLRKWTSSVCLHQLSLDDNPDPRETFIYKLSQKPGLQYFTNVLLLSSPADKYAPYHSARVELHQAAEKDKKTGPIYNEMVYNILEPLTGVNLTKFDICFSNDKKSFDSLIGRAAHIYFLDQPLYIMMLLVIYEHYFR